MLVIFELHPSGSQIPPHFSVSFSHLPPRAALPFVLFLCSSDVAQKQGVKEW